MPARFIIGRAGTGKTRRCFDEIVAMLRDAPLGPPIYWLLPRQATFTAERMLTCGSGLPAFSRARVLSFSEFGREILAECGGAAIPEITAVGRQMILGHLLRTHRDDLKFFKSVSHQSGLASELDATFAEFEHGGKTADDLARFKDEVSDPALAAKLHDLALLYAAYSKFLGQDRLDPHRRLMQVLDCIDRSKLIAGATVFVDGFYEFTDYERRFLAALSLRASRVDITLTLDPNSAVLMNPQSASKEMDTFHLPEQTYRRLHAVFVEMNVLLDQTVFLRNTTRFSSPAIRHLETCLFTKEQKSATETAGIDLIEAPDRRAEVDAAARQIQSLLEKGLRLRDIAVLVRDIEAYHELIDASFREHALPWFVDRRRSATHHPLIQFARALPSLAIHNFDHDSVMAILKSGLCAISADEADELENYVLLHRIHRGAWADATKWNFAPRTLTRDDSETSSADRGFANDPARIAKLRARLIDPLLPFVRLLNQPAPARVRDIVARMLEAFDACEISQTLSRWIEEARQRGQVEQHAEHARVWNELTEVLDQMTELLGDELVKPEDFAEILESALATFDLTLTPPTIDQVLVGSVDRTRTPPQLRAVIVMGMHEGGFPLCETENSIFGDSERRALSRSNIDLDPDTRRRLLDERFLRYIAFTRASEFLCVTRPLADDAGRPFAPSPFWRSLRIVFPSVIPLAILRAGDADGSQIGTPRQLVTSLLRWARSKNPAGEIWPAIYDRFVRNDFNAPKIEMLRSLAWRSLSYQNVAQLSAKLSARLFSSPLRSSVTRIETFANCPFKHFARYGLKLLPRDEEDVTQMDLGIVYHDILEKLVREMVRKRIDFTNAAREFTDEQISLLATRIGESLRNEVMLSTARNKYLLRHVERTLAQLVDSQRELAKRGKFRPWKTEVYFGSSAADSGNSLPALTLQTPAGKQVELTGKIDRVDLIEQDAAFAVIDYKLSGSTLRLESVYHGLSLQLLTYLLVLQKSGEKLHGSKLTPAAAFYVKLLRKLDPVKHPDDALSPDDAEFHLKDKPRGIFDQTYLRSLDDSLETGSSNVVQAFLKKDGALGKKSDALDTNQFAAMLKFVEKKLIELADQILTGEISVAPYRVGTATPCPNCEFRSVCRFDPASQDYRTLNKITRQDVIEIATTGKRARAEGEPRG